MENNTTSSFSRLASKLLKNADLAFIVALFGVVLLLIFPITPGFMDVLIAISIAVSLLVMLIVVYVKDPAEFSIFPTMLLAVTLYRLGLNVATTRLILLDGNAGNVIDSFGRFVVRGNYVVGAVVFLILIVINFVVITKGAGRIAEVAARFTLDAMPGKQMAIDAELNAGVIDEVTANKRRTKIQKEADFYGSMDGASKFVRGDAIAGILITFINVTGGIAIGFFQKNLDLVEALQKYTLLSIGDGLVSQVPALIVSVAAGILVTRNNEGINLGENLGKQLIFSPRVMYIAGAMMLFFAIMPGMPFTPFASLAVFLGVVAYHLKTYGFSQDNEAVQELKDGKPALSGTIGEEAKERPKPGSTEDLKTMIEVDTFAVELGCGLLSLVDKKESGDLLERITGVRQKFARTMGIIIPPIAVRDNLELENNQYRFLLRNKEVASGSLIPNRWLAMNVSNSEKSLKGTDTTEPVFGLKATWVDDAEKKIAEVNGYTVVDAPSVTITHLSEILKDAAHAILEREDVQKLVDAVKEKHPTLISELLPDLVNVGIIQRVLQNLLKENISIKNLTLILETIADYATATKNPDDLSEQARKRLGAYFVPEYLNQEGLLQGVTLEPRLEQTLISKVKRTQFEISLLMDPMITQGIMKDLAPRLNQMAEQGLEPIVITSTELRLAFKRFFEPSFPRMTVIAYQEIPAQVQVQSVGIIALSNDVINKEQPMPASQPSTGK